MPLSEQEQRLLEEMERSLYHNDADFASSGSAHRGKPTYGMVVLGVLIGVVGISTMIAGVVVRLPIVGVIGFVLMFVGVLVALTPPRNGRLDPGAPRQGAAPDAAHGDSPAADGKANGSSFLQNLGDRWEKRQEERDE